MKIEIKGKLSVVGVPVQKSEKFTVQTVVISRFWMDENEEKIEKIYPFQVMNDAIQKLNLKSMEGKTVVATGYLNGIKTEKGEYFANLRLHSVAVSEKIAVEATASTNGNDTVGDDLPF